MSDFAHNKRTLSTQIAAAVAGAATRAATSTAAAEVNRNDIIHCTRYMRCVCGTAKQ